MTAKDIQIGQNISAGFFFRCGHYGDDVGLRHYYRSGYTQIGML